MNWKVKFETGILGIDLVVCSLEKVTPIKKPLVRQSQANWTWIESRTFDKLWLIRFRHFTSPWKRVVLIWLSVLKRPLDKKLISWHIWVRNLLDLFNSLIYHVRLVSWLLFISNATLWVCLANLEIFKPSSSHNLCGIDLEKLQHHRAHAGWSSFFAAVVRD